MLTASAHAELLDALLAHKGPVILSGYDHQLYNEKLRKWRKVVYTGKSNSGGPRQEILWMNFDGGQRTLFDREATP